LFKFLYRVWIVAAVAYLAVLVSVATADAPVHPSPVLALQSKQTWALMIGALVPLVTYVVNHIGPWVSEPVKATVTVLTSAVAGALYTALATTSFGWNSATLQMVLTTVISTLGAHQFLWKPSGISARLGGGTNGSKSWVGHHLGWVTDPPAEPPAPPAA
jgi:hypothetical protein